MAIQAEQLLWMINNERARRWGSWSPDRLNNPQTMADLIREDFPAARGGLGVEDVRSFFRTLAENGAVRQAMQTYQAAHPDVWRTVLALAESPAIDVDNGRGIAWRPGMLNPADRIMAGLAVVQSSLTASVTYVSCVNNNVDNDEAVAWAAFAGGVADIIQVSVMGAAFYRSRAQQPAPPPRPPRRTTVPLSGGSRTDLAERFAEKLTDSPPPAQRGPQLRVINGALPASAPSQLRTATAAARRLMPGLIESGSGRMRPARLSELDRTLTESGYRLIRAEPYGPEGGYQLFWQNGNVLVRFKTLGEQRGPRANQPHLSVGYNDGRGLDWQNDLGKFDWNGNVVAKVITDPARFNPVDFQGNPQRFVLVPANFDIASVDAWASRTHFPAGAGFLCDGLQALIRRVRQ